MLKLELDEWKRDEKGPDGVFVSEQSFYTWRHGKNAFGGEPDLEKSRILAFSRGDNPSEISLAICWATGKSAHVSEKEGSPTPSRRNLLPRRH